jgi:hypothetical protein
MPWKLLDFKINMTFLWPPSLQLIKCSTVIFCAELAKWCCISLADGIQIENRFTRMAVSPTQTKLCMCQHLQNNACKLSHMVMTEWYAFQHICFITWGKWSPATQCHVIWAIKSVMRQSSYSWKLDNYKILSAPTAISHLFKCDSEELPISTLLLEMGGTIIIIQHVDCISYSRRFKVTLQWILRSQSGR